jgi:hypothetical protein
MMKTKNIGSSFDDFLKEEALLDEATAVAVKRVIAWQIDQEMKSQKLTNIFCFHHLFLILSFAKSRSDLGVA